MADCKREKELERLCSKLLLMCRNADFSNGVQGLNGEDEGVIRSCEAMVLLERDAADLDVYNIGSTLFDIDNYYGRPGEGDG